MKRVFLAGIIICLILVGGAVGMAKFHSQPDTVLTETILAKRDHLKVLWAISEMCTDKSVATNPDNPVAVLSVRAPLGSNEGVPYPVFSQKPTTFQMAAKNYSEELRDQRIKLDQEINAGQSESWWFKVAIAALGGLAAIMIGLKPLFEKFDSLKLINTSIAAAAIIFSGTVGTLSSVSAFADAQARSLQYQRTLAQLQQLHWRVGNDVFAATSLCATGANPDLQKVGAWKYRFEEITNEAMPSVAKPGDLAQPQKDTASIRTIAAQETPAGRVATE
jgi:hypothetical protein